MPVAGTADGLVDAGGGGLVDVGRDGLVIESRVGPGAAIIRTMITVTINGNDGG